MSWQVHGNSAGLFFSLDEDGLSISGSGRHYPNPGAQTSVDMGSLESLPAEWSLYRASHASEIARVVGLNTKDMKEHLDPAKVKIIETPICTIHKHEECVGFAAFLPDDHFSSAFGLLKLITQGSSMSYVLTFEFVGFLPQRIVGAADFVAYEEWLAGRPYVCKNGFRLQLRA